MFGTQSTREKHSYCIYSQAGQLFADVKHTQNKARICCRDIGAALVAAGLILVLVSHRQILAAPGVLGRALHILGPAVSPNCKPNWAAGILSTGSSVQRIHFPVLQSIIAQQGQENPWISPIRDPHPIREELWGQVTTTSEFHGAAAPWSFQRAGTHLRCSNWSLASSLCHWLEAGAFKKEAELPKWQGNEDSNSWVGLIQAFQP